MDSSAMDAFDLERPLELGSESARPRARSVPALPQCQPLVCDDSGSPTVVCRSRLSLPVSRNWEQTAKARIYMTDFFASLAHTHWKRLWPSIFFCYVLSWGFWAVLLYTMNRTLEKPTHIKCCLAHTASWQQIKFADYYFFAVETMTTIGFGAYHLQCRWMNAMVSLMSLHADFLHASMFGVVLAKISMPGKRGNSILMSETLCGHVPTGTVAFRLINARKHAVHDPSLKVFLVTPRRGNMPEFQELSPRLSIPMEFLELPQTVSVKVGAFREWRNKYVVAIFSATDGVSGGAFEVRKRWSLRTGVECGKDFAPMLDHGADDGMTSFDHALNMNQFQRTVDTDSCLAPTWALEGRCTLEGAGFG